MAGSCNYSLTVPFVEVTLQPTATSARDVSSEALGGRRMQRFTLQPSSRHLPDGTPVVSEFNILKHIQALEDIGYRIVGTEEAEAGELYVYDQVEALANQCALSEVLECSVWYQKGDGMHQSVIDRLSVA